MIDDYTMNALPKMSSPFMFFILMFIFIFILIWYIFNGIALMKIATRQGIKYIWLLAWVPICSSFLLAKCSNCPYNKLLAWSVMITSIIGLFFKNLTNPILIALASIPWILNMIAYYFLYKQYSDKYIIMTIVSGFSFGMFAPFMLFAIRNNPKRIS